MEAASVLVSIAESVTVVCSTEEPLPAFGKDVGKAIRKVYFSLKYKDSTIGKNSERK